MTLRDYDERGLVPWPAEMIWYIRWQGYGKNCGGGGLIYMSVPSPLCGKSGGKNLFALVGFLSGKGMVHLVLTGDTFEHVGREVLCAGGLLIARKAVQPCCGDKSSALR